MTITNVHPIKSLTELAELVGRNKSQITRWVRRDDWPFGSAPWPRRKVPEILNWVATNIRDRSDVKSITPTEAAAPAAEAVKQGRKPSPVSDTISELKTGKLSQEVRKLRAQADTAETALAKERGALLDASKVEDEWAAVGVAIRNGFQSLGAQLTNVALSQGMPSENAPEFQTQAEASITGILRHLSRDGKSENHGDRQVPAV